MIKRGVLPLYIDDGTLIDCVSISGGADSTNGVPNQLTIAIKRPDGSEQQVRYVRSRAVHDAVAAVRRQILEDVNAFLRSTDNAEDVGWNNAVTLISRRIEQRGPTKTKEANNG